MVGCEYCGREAGMPYQCRLCGATFCSEHRLPENHECPGLEQWNDPGGVFDSGFDPSVSGQAGSSRSITRRLLRRLGVGTGPGGLGGYVRRNMTYVFLAIMWLVFPLELLVAYGLQAPQLFSALFTLDTNHVAYVWTWVTSIFAHSPTNFMHIFFNSIVLYFFGPVVERKIGTKAFTMLFLGSGVVAGLAQILATMAVGGSASLLGASGAIAALLGVLTVLNPNLRIYLYFILPMPLWVATALFAAYSVFVSTLGGISAGGVAQLAHLAGLGIGLAYGLYLKRTGTRAPQQLRIGGGGQRRRRP
ncbi:MAG: rhomboid family intramembrane serine protease [Halodesulfurarchaeum sp.]